MHFTIDTAVTGACIHYKTQALGLVRHVENNEPLLARVKNVAYTEVKPKGVFLGFNIAYV